MGRLLTCATRFGECLEEWKGDPKFSFGCLALQAEDRMGWKCKFMSHLYTGGNEVAGQDE